MQIRTLKKWLVRLVLLSLVGGVGTFFWIDGQLNQMYGAHTEVVDPAQFAAQRQRLMIANVNVLSPNGEAMLPERTVVIEDGVITAVLDAEVVTPADGVRIDGRGRYLIPGLTDAHVHLWQSANDLLLYLANGVTHVRELNGSEEHLRWREEISTGRLGPRLFVASGRLNSFSLIKGWFARWTSKTVPVASAPSVAPLLQDLQETGFDAIKVYSHLSAEHYAAVNAAAAALDVPIIGHLPLAVDLDALWASRQTELAHIEELVKALDREFGGFTRDDTAAFLAFVQQRSAALAENLRRKDIAVVSTLWLMESFARQKAELPAVLDEVALAYANPGITEGTPLTSRGIGWLPEVNIYRLPADYPADRRAGNRRYWDAYAEANRILLRALNAAGVRLLAGTDANVPVAVPGFSMHDELLSLQRAGLNPAETLRAATATPADHLGDASGRVLVGQRADLVLLNANPLEDIGHTRAIEAVIVDGRLLTRATLDAMLAAVRAANDASRQVDVRAHAH